MAEQRKSEEFYQLSIYYCHIGTPPLYITHLFSDLYAISLDLYIKNLLGLNLGALSTLLHMKATENFHSGVFNSMSREGRQEHSTGAPNASRNPSQQNHQELCHSQFSNLYKYPKFIQMKAVCVAKYSQLHLSSYLNFQDVLFVKVALVGKLAGEKNLLCCCKPSYMESPL